MQLSDRSIRRMLGVGQLGIEPRPHDRRFQPATVDLTLGDVRGENGLPFVMRPGAFTLGSTIERITLPRNVSAIVKGKSTWARRGLMVECAGFVDPGFDGQLTLELKNLHEDNDITLRFEDAICQIAFYVTDTACARQYGDPDLGSHYQGQFGPTPARR